MEGESATLSQKFRLQNMNKTRNCFLEEIEQNELMSRKHKKTWIVLNYIELLLILAYWMYILFSFASFTGISIKITSSAIGLKICVVTAQQWNNLNVN